MQLANNLFTVIRPAELGPLQALRMLNLSGNKLENIDFVTVLPKLESLDVSHNLINKLPNMKKCSCLSEVNFSYNLIETLSGLSSCQQLTTLNISNNKLRSMRSIGPTKLKMETLTAENNFLETVEDICTFCPNIEVLNVSKNKIDNKDKVFASLYKMSELVELKCLDNPGLLSVPPSEIHRALPNLEMINGVSYYKKPLQLTGDPASVRPQTPSLGMNTSRAEKDTDDFSSQLNAAILRPRTANTGITIRQLDTIFNDMDSLLEGMRQSFSNTLEKVVTTLETDSPQCHNESGTQKCKSCQEREKIRNVEDEPVSDDQDPRNLPSSQVESKPVESKTQTNTLTRRLQHARSFSNKMISQTGIKAPATTTKTTTTTTNRLERSSSQTKLVRSNSGVRTTKR